MPTREELKALIDQIPSDKLELVGLNLNQILHPPSLDPKVEEMMRRSDEMQKYLVERLPQLQAGCKPETIRGFSGGGSFGGFPGQRAGGEVCYSWWEGITHITHKLMLHAGREVDIVERLQLTEDETKLIFEVDIYAEGRAVKLKEDFPMASTADGNSLP